MFSERKETLTRSQLIGGMVATGALAACGGGVSPNPAPTASAAQCTLTSPKTVGVSEIFSDPVFKNLDKRKLVELFDPSARLETLRRGYFAQAGRKPQIGAVIGSIPSAGIVISSPGTYTLAGDILWTPGADNSSAITIQCSDVTLNLAGFTLTASVPDKSWQTTGILVGGTGNAAVANITITNGTVANLTEYGIMATGVCGLDISEITVTGLCMQNLNVRALTPAGIHVGNSLEVAISGCSVTQSNVTTDSSAGIFLIGTLGATVSGCRAVSLVNNDGAVQGFGYINCVGVKTTGCTADSLQSYFNNNVKTTGHTVLGFVPIFCWDLSYVDCSASGLTGSCDDCHGMSVFLNGNVAVTRFRADNVVDGPPPYNSGAKATGLEVYGAGVTVTDCVVSNITSINPQDKQATGFSAWGLAIQFERCKAGNVVAQDSSGGSLGMGFGWAPDPRPLFDFGAIDVTYTDCIADNCQVGFDTWYHVDSKWIRPVYTNCGTGILIQPAAQRTLFCDACSECPPGGLLNPPGVSLNPPGAFATLTNIAKGNTIVP